MFIVIKNYKIGYTQGTYDTLHYGHINLLKHPKENSLTIYQQGIDHTYIDNPNFYYNQDGKKYINIEFGNLIIDKTKINTSYEDVLYLESVNGPRSTFSSLVNSYLFKDEYKLLICQNDLVQ